MAGKSGSGKILALASAVQTPADPEVIEAAVSDWLDDHPEAVAPIDDTAGEGDTDKLWSADKTAGEVTTLSEAIVPKAETKTSDASSVDLDLTDENGNVLARFAGGHIETKYFNSRTPENLFYGKKYAALGDSVTYGFIPRNYEGYPGQLDSFAKLTAEALGMTFTNYGISGSTLAYHADRSPMSRRYSELPNDADLITVMGGTNDIRFGITLGQMSDRTDATFYGALHVVLGGLYKKYCIDQGVTIGKTKKIIVCTPLKLLQSSSETQGGEGTLVDMSDWVDAIKEVAAYYAMPVMDFYNNSTIVPHICQTLQGTETGYTGYYNPYITDGTHPTQEAAEIMAEEFIGFLKTLK